MLYSAIKGIFCTKPRIHLVYYYNTLNINLIYASKPKRIYANIKLGILIKEYNLNTVGMAIISDMRSS